VENEPEELIEAELTIAVSFTEPELRLLRRRAKDAGMSPTAFIRRAALGADPLALEQTLLAASTIGIEDDELRVGDVARIGIPGADAGSRSGGASAAGGAAPAGPAPGSAEQISTAQAKAMLSGLIAGAERERTS
jgi:hypothetical protein